MHDFVSDIKKRRLLWGVLLAWIPFLFFAIPTIIGIVRAFRNAKATGLAAAAGGFTAFLATFGLATAIAFEITAIALLLRSFSGNSARSAISILSICCSGFMLAIIALFLWLTFLYPH